MARSTLIFVSDDQTSIQKVQQFGQSNGFTVDVYSSSQWAQMNGKEVPSLAGGNNPVTEGAKILNFPVGQMRSGDGAIGSVETMNELESKAIVNAIHTYRGNLTEAAKALGIGRATLYRKVKQYNIDPTSARKKRAA